MSFDGNYCNYRLGAVCQIVHESHQFRASCQCALKISFASMIKYQIEIRWHIHRCDERIQSRLLCVWVCVWTETVLVFKYQNINIVIRLEVEHRDEYRNVVHMGIIAWIHPPSTHSIRAAAVLLHDIVGIIINC